MTTFIERQLALEERIGAIEDWRLSFWFGVATIERMAVMTEVLYPLGLPLRNVAWKRVRQSLDRVWERDSEPLNDVRKQTKRWMPVDQDGLMLDPTEDAEFGYGVAAGLGDLAVVPQQDVARAQQLALALSDVLHSVLFHQWAYASPHADVIDGHVNVRGDRLPTAIEDNPGGLLVAASEDADLEDLAARGSAAAMVLRVRAQAVAPVLAQLVTQWRV